MWNGNGHAYNSSWFEGARETLHDFGEKARGYGGSLTEQVKAHPLAAAGIAFAIGYVVTRLVRR